LPFSKFGSNGLEFELSTYSLWSNNDTASFESKSNSYVVSGAFNYGLFLVKGLKISAGGGYYYGWVETKIESSFGNSTANSSVNDIFYQGTLEYLISDSFGLNVRYDEILGINFGITLTY
jgi:hypothetical protein